MSQLTSLTLEDADGVDVPLMIPGYRLVKQATGLAALTVRDQTRPRPGGHGQITTTRWRDARAPIFDLVFLGEDDDRVWDEYYTVAQVVAGAVDTDRTLKWTAGSLPLQTMVRAIELTDPVAVGGRMIAAQLTLRAPDPRAYSQDEHVTTIPPLALGHPGGMALPIVFPVYFNAASLTGGEVFNDGSLPTPLTFDLHGYLDSPVVKLGDQQIAFDGEIADGDTLTVDMDRKTVTLNGTANRLGMVAFRSTQWFDLPPGRSIVTLVAPAFSGAASVDLRWRDAR